MSEKVKINNNGDWVCPKCEAQNSEHKDNIKRIDKALCNSCYSEFELDKDNLLNNENLEIEEKLKQANGNIEILVKEIVKLCKERDRSYCVHPQEKYDNENFCDSKCNECKNKFYNEMKEYLLKEYQIVSE